MEVTGRRGRIRKQLLEEVKQTKVYWKMQRETLNRFEKGYGPIVIQTT
jgi:hypothetical protein